MSENPDAPINHFDFLQESPELRARRKAVATKCGHVKRRLKSGKRLTGKTLAFALGVVGDGYAPSGSMEGEIAKKLKEGQRLDGYEEHVLVDVLLLHTRLGVR
jgi:hypothetical protein